MKLKPVREQVVVVMGASSGIGRETALRFAREGARVVASARSEDALQSLVEEIRAGGGEATCLLADVAEFEQVRAVAEHTVATFGRIDTWVHVAGVGIWSTFQELKPEEWRRVVDVNLNGQAYGAMAALPHLKRAGGGALIHVSSGEARVVMPWQSAYAASKHGISAFLRTLRIELQREGAPISVTEILPSGINTPFFNKARSRVGFKPIPLRQVYAPSLVADAILYAAEHPTPEIPVGGVAKGSLIMNRISPRLVDTTMLLFGFAGQKTDEPKDEASGDNLFEPLPGQARTEGDYADQERRTSASTWLATHPNASRALGIAALGAIAAALWSRRRTPGG